MKGVKLGLRIWIAITAFFGFLGGWVMLAHSGKPASTFVQPALAAPGQVQSLPTLPPLDFNNQNSQPANQPLQIFPSNSRNLPNLRTMGS